MGLDAREGRTYDLMMGGWRLALGSLAIAAAIASCVGGGSSDEDGPDGSPGDDANGSDGPGSPDGGTSDDGASSVDACAGKDLTNDPRHCGSCFHDCALGGCAGGKCEPWVVTTAAGTVTALEVDNAGERIYYGLGPSVWRVQPDGGSPESVTTLPSGAAVSTLTRSGLGMLACSSEGIHQVPVAPGAPTPLFPVVTSCVGIVADGTTIWASGGGTIFEVRTATNQTLQHPAPPFPNQPSGELEVDGTYLYFLTDTNGVRRVAKAAVDGGSTRVGPGPFTNPGGLALAGDHAYVTAFMPRALTRITLDGGAVTELVSLDGGGYTYAQRAAHSAAGALLFFAVGSRVMGFVPP